MTDYTRVTVVGSTRRAELVVPSDVALGSLVPRLVELLEERTGSAARPLTLVRPTGEQLDLALSAADQGLDDGELLSLSRQDETPPPPEIADVTDVLADQHASRAGQWGSAAREATGALAIGLFMCVGGIALLGEASLRVELVLAGVLGVLLLTAVVAGRVGGRWVAIAATAAAIGLTPAAALALLSGVDADLHPVALAGVAVAGGWLAVLLGIGVGLGSRPALWGALLGLVLAALPALLTLSGWSPAEIAGVTGIVATVACGLLPWYAMSASGLTGLDDEVVDGRPRRREVVLLTVSAAYRTLSWAVAAVALPLAAGIAVLLADENPWAAGLGLALLLVAALRTRSLTLTVQAVALWAAVLAAATAGILMTPILSEGWRAASLAALAVLAALAAGLRLAQHQRAGLRRFGNAVELIAVIASVPLLLGTFGVYADLLEAF